MSVWRCIWVKSGFILASETRRKARERRKIKEYRQVLRVFAPWRPGVNLFARLSENFLAWGARHFEDLAVLDPRLCAETALHGGVL
jgi:hypothetical protein